MLFLMRAKNYRFNFHLQIRQVMSFQQMFLSQNLRLHRDMCLTSETIKTAANDFINLYFTINCLQQLWIVRVTRKENNDRIF